MSAASSSEVVAEPTLDDHLAVLARAILQAGLSWRAIDAKWPALRAIYDDFAQARVAAWGEREVRRATEAPGGIASPAKTEAIVHAARTLAEIVRADGSIAAYARRFGDYAAAEADVHARFRRVGAVSCYTWFFRTGLPVPRFESWIAAQPKDHPRVREMVAAARAAGRSPEEA